MVRSWSIRERMCTSKLLGGLAAVTVLIVGCEDPPTPPMPSGSARPVSSAAGSASAAKPPPPRTLEPPTAEEIGALDVKGACMAICETQVRCSVSAEVADDAAQLAERQKGCVDSCKRTAPPKEVEEEYLSRARRCLTSKDCNAFNSCAFATSP